ncbi:MAG: metalloregulator ArsR/SmtB family transcription factor [Rhodothermales bacterium]
MDQLDLTFSALANPIRRAILSRLAEGEATVTELMEPFEISQPAISRHLKVLEDAGLVSVNPQGPSRPRRIEAARLSEASGWLDRYRAIWEANYGRLDEVLAKLQANPEGTSDDTTPTDNTL